MSRAASVVALTFSMPDATKSSTAVCAYWSHGYGTPKRSEKKSSISLVRLNVGSIVSSIPRGTLYVNRDVVPGILLFLVFPGHKRNQICGNRQGLPPGPRFLAVGRVLNAEQLSVGNRKPIARNGQNHFRSRAVVRIIVDGNVVVRVFRFALRPDFLGAVGIVLVGQNEIKAGGRLAFITSDSTSNVSPDFAGCARLHVQLVVAKVKRGVLAVDARAQNREVRAIEIEMRQRRRATWRECASLRR